MLAGHQLGWLAVNPVDLDLVRGEAVAEAHLVSRTWDPSCLSHGAPELPRKPRKPLGAQGQGQSVAGKVRQMLARHSRCWQDLSDADRVHQMMARPMEFEDGRRELEDGHPRAALSLSTPSVEGTLLWCTTPVLAFWFSPVLEAHVPRTSTWQSSRGSEDSPEELGAQRQKPRASAASSSPPQAWRRQSMPTPHEQSIPTNT